MAKCVAACMPPGWRTRSWVVVFAAVLLTPASRADERARALLRGVEQTRLGMTVGTVRMAVTNRRGAKGEGEVKDLAISFDGERRTSVQVGDILVVKPENASRNEAIAKMKPSEAVAQGLAEIKRQEIRNGWEGATYNSYWVGSSRAYVMPSAKGLSEYVFDPRILGISTDLSPSATPTSCLGYENCREIKTIGRETVNGWETWHVAVTTAIGTKLDFWVEDTAGFRVHRMQWDAVDLPLVNVCDSEYAPDDKVSTLPKVTHIVRYAKRDEKQKIAVGKLTVQIAQAEVAPQSPPPGSLASLHLPIGTEVIDGRINKSMGFWDGATIVREMPRSKPTPATQAQPTDARTAVVSVPVIAAASVAATCIIGLLAFLVRRRKSGLRAPS